MQCGFTVFEVKWVGRLNKSLFQALLERWEVAEGSSPANMTFTSDSPPPNARKESRIH